MYALSPPRSRGYDHRVGACSSDVGAGAGSGDGLDESEWTRSEFSRFEGLISHSGQAQILKSTAYGGFI